MEEYESIRLICQYLKEHNFQEALAALEKESGRRYIPEVMDCKDGELQEILDDHITRKRFEEEAAVSASELFSPGNGNYANELWTSLDYLTEGYNVLVVRLVENGALAIGGSKALIVTTQIPIPLSLESPPQSVISETHKICKGAVLALDFHPTKRNILLCASMDRCAFIMDLEQPQNPLIQMFNDHDKYVVRALWSSTGEYFVTGSYDKTVCIYRKKGDSDLYEQVCKIDFKGAVEAIAMSKQSDVFVVGVRNDHHLHCIDFSSGNPNEVRQININAFGDDYVSFTVMHITFSPDDRYILISTDRDRLILFDWASGNQIANFYGAANDAYSQPRHCWDPSGQYIYGTSQDKSICVWEIKSQEIVARLEGHSGIVQRRNIFVSSFQEHIYTHTFMCVIIMRDVHFCKELGLLLSCGFDGAVKLWKNSHQTAVKE